MSLQHNSQAKRFLWITLGWLCVVVGVIGLALPGLPTTGPLLLALGCFSKGSQRLHDWLFEHPVLGPPLRMYKKTGTMPLQAKLIALGMMALSFMIIAYLAPMQDWLRGLTKAIIIIGMVFVVWIPHSNDEA